MFHVSALAPSISVALRLRVKKQAAPTSGPLSIPQLVVGSDLLDGNGDSG